MGFFDKIKKAANFLTGGGADVKLAIEDGIIGNPLPATITLKIGDNDINAEKVYLIVRCTETTKTVAEVEEGAEVDPEAEPEMEENQEYLHNETITVADGQVFEAGKEYTFTTEVKLPEDAQATLEEENREIYWSFQAGIDVRGNDPDSGWILVNIAAPEVEAETDAEPEE